jgi:hypothetical protein
MAVRAKRKPNLSASSRASSRGYDVVIGARRKHFESHAAAHRYGLDQQNKGVHASFVIRDAATGKAEEFKRGGARRNKKRNPEAAAAEMRESFTGLPSKRTEVVSEDVHVHTHLAALGELIELKGKTVKREPFVIEFNAQKNPKGKPFNDKIKGWVGRRAKAFSGTAKYLADYWINPRKLNPNGPVLLCSTENGKHLYIEGGDQKINLAAVGLGELSSKESAVIGTVTHVVYHVQKKFDGKVEEYDYVHKFSEDSDGLRPMLRYDIRNAHLYLDGGVYHIPRPLMGTSQGITD